MSPSLQIVTLSENELREAERLGLDRLHESRKSGRYAHASERERNYYHRMIDDLSGAAAEYAVCKHLRLPWEARIDTFHQVADVSTHFEVRSSCLAQNNKLIVRDDDPDDRWYVLVKANEQPVFKIMGMMLGAEAKQDRWLADPHSQRPAWFVPAYALQTVRRPPEADMGFPVAA